jgi:uncharacterized membrane protein YkvA (DUF1232 family)
MADQTTPPDTRAPLTGMDFDAAAERMRLGKRRILQGAARIGEELSARLAEVPLFGHDQAVPSGWKRLVERWSKRITIRSIMRLVVHRKQVRTALQEIPIRMQLVTNQVRLVLELIDDFAEGAYRDVPWHSMAVAAGAILYSVSPADIVPDVLPLVGSLDDLFVVGLALKLVEKDLRAYAVSKKYDLNEYFPEPDSKAPARSPGETGHSTGDEDAREGPPRS